MNPMPALICFSISSMRGAVNISILKYAYQQHVHRKYQHVHSCKGSQVLIPIVILGSPGSHAQATELATCLTERVPAAVPIVDPATQVQKILEIGPGPGHAANKLLVIVMATRELMMALVGPELLKEAGTSVPTSWLQAFELVHRHVCATPSHPDSLHAENPEGVLCADCTAIIVPLDEYCTQPSQWAPQVREIAGADSSEGVKCLSLRRSFVDKVIDCDRDMAHPNQAYPASNPMIF